ncbi:zinc finger MYND domain-containing protein 19-like isoform X1 [Ostrea edulis]|uniref:zinc finger MYND domain-containing protein 19-like isoform X1 n=1 Tax=Ostrea edulis TaxID=37623 RepID=UPI0024AF9E22|nr:zinc finger MYND domain-containing protein 19-like isoform X1 [Ostrea edulis]
MSGQKLGIVSLGKAAGKVKFALLDERDIGLINHYAFEAKVEVDPDGNGAHIYAYTYNMIKGRESGQFLHDFLWATIWKYTLYKLPSMSVVCDIYFHALSLTKYLTNSRVLLKEVEDAGRERHRGGIAAGWKVVHNNGVTVDNRLENLVLVPMDMQLVYDDLPSTKNREHSLYWMAVQQLQVAPLECHYPSSHVYTKQFSPNGEDVHIDHDEVCVYYECHYPPCTNMEKRVREFSICGRCQEVRYCGTYCQQRDWPTHKKFCQERKLFFPLEEESPDR